MAEKLGAAQIIEAVEQMTVLELSELVRALEQRFGVSAAVPVVAAAPAATVAQAEAPAQEEKFEFDVLLQEVGPNKIQVIKAIREITGLGLRESKELVDGAPSTVRQAVNKEEAEAARAKLEAAGAVIQVK